MPIIDDEDGMQIKFKVLLSAAPSLSPQHKSLDNVTIGFVPVSRKATWEDIDKRTSDLFLVRVKLTQILSKFLL